MLLPGRTVELDAVLMSGRSALAGASSFFIVPCPDYQRLAVDETLLGLTKNVSSASSMVSPLMVTGISFVVARIESQIALVATYF
jgi:hypothetical protein